MFYPYLAFPLEEEPLTIAVEVRMAFLDFIKNRQASQQQSVAENTQSKKPETAKEMYSREGQQEAASRKPLEQMPPDQQAKAAEIKARLEKATQHQGKAAANAPAPSDASGSPEAMRQKAMHQDASAPPLSPTSAQMGKTQAEANAPANSAQRSETPSKSSQAQSNQRPQTLPRRPPSWER